jgi:alpha-glucosidase
MSAVRTLLIIGTTACAPNPLEGTWSLDEVEIKLIEGRALSIHHPVLDQPWLETQGSDWLQAAQAELDSTESQGSFLLEETETHRCERARLWTIEEQSSRLIMQGTFEDESPACSSLEFTLEFFQHNERQLELSLETSSPDFNLLGLYLARSDAPLVGMGEQFFHQDLDLSDREIPVIVQEGGIGRGDPDLTDLVEALSPGSGGSEDSSYAPMPYLASSDGWGLLLDNTEVSFFDLRQDDSLEIRVHSAQLEAQLFAAPQPLELITELTAHTGRMPELPSWVGSGAIVALARPLDESMEIVEEMLEHGTRISGVWNQTWSGTHQTWVGEQVLWNWTLDVEKEESWPEWQSALETEGIRTLCYINPMLYDVSEHEPQPRRNLFAEASEAGHLLQDQAGAVQMLPVTAFDVGLLDLSSEPARDWMKAVILTEMVETAGCSGWMADFGEALPLDAHLASGESGLTAHNRYPVDWASLHREAIEEAGLLGEALVFSRSGFTGTSGAAIAMWEGDQSTNWGAEDGLESALHGLLSGGFSGLALNHSDVGGYTSLSLAGLERDAELLARWTEMATFTAILRTHEGNQPEANAQVYTDDSTLEHFSRMTRVYAALAPLRAPLLEEASSLGWPVVRHMALHYPDDPTAWTIHDQLMLGPDLILAPILEPCEEAECIPVRELYLPEGNWQHLWSSTAFESPESGSWVNIEAPLGEPAVFLRQGSIEAESFVEALHQDGFEIDQE